MACPHCGADTLRSGAELAAHISGAACSARGHAPSTSRQLQRAASTESAGRRPDQEDHGDRSANARAGIPGAEAGVAHSVDPSVSGLGVAHGGSTNERGAQTGGGTAGGMAPPPPPQLAIALARPKRALQQRQRYSPREEERRSRAQPSNRRRPRSVSASSTDSATSAAASARSVSSAVTATSAGSSVLSSTKGGAEPSRTGKARPAALKHAQHGTGRRATATATGGPRGDTSPREGRAVAVVAREGAQPPPPQQHDESGDYAGPHGRGSARFTKAGKRMGRPPRPADGATSTSTARHGSSGAAEANEAHAAGDAVAAAAAPAAGSPQAAHTAAGGTHVSVAGGDDRAAGSGPDALSAHASGTSSHPRPNASSHKADAKRRRSDGSGVDGAPARSRRGDGTIARSGERAGTEAAKTSTVSSGVMAQNDGYRAGVVDVDAMPVAYRAIASALLAADAAAMENADGDGNGGAAAALPQLAAVVEVAPPHRDGACPYATHGSSSAGAVALSAAAASRALASQLARRLNAPGSTPAVRLYSGVVRRFGRWHAQLPLPPQTAASRAWGSCTPWGTLRLGTFSTAEEAARAVDAAATALGVPWSLNLGGDTAAATGVDAVPAINPNVWCAVCCDNPCVTACEGCGCAACLSRVPHDAPLRLHRAGASSTAADAQASTPTAASSPWVSCAVCFREWHPACAEAAGGRVETAGARRWTCAGCAPRDEGDAVMKVGDDRASPHGVWAVASALLRGLTSPRSSSSTAAAAAAALPAHPSANLLALTRAWMARVASASRAVDDRGGSLTGDSRDVASAPAAAASPHDAHRLAWLAHRQASLAAAAITGTGAIPLHAAARGGASATGPGSRWGATAAAATTAKAASGASSGSHHDAPRSDAASSTGVGSRGSGVVSHHRPVAGAGASKPSTADPLALVAVLQQLQQQRATGASDKSSLDRGTLRAEGGALLDSTMEVEPLVAGTDGGGLITPPAVAADALANVAPTTDRVIAPRDDDVAMAASAVESSPQTFDVAALPPPAARQLAAALAGRPFNVYPDAAFNTQRLFLFNTEPAGDGAPPDATTAAAAADGVNPVRQRVAAVAAAAARRRRSSGAAGASIAAPSSSGSHGRGGSSSALAQGGGGSSTSLGRPQHDSSGREALRGGGGVASAGVGNNNGATSSGGAATAEQLRHATALPDASPSTAVEAIAARRHATLMRAALRECDRSASGGGTHQAAAASAVDTPAEAAPSSGAAAPPKTGGGALAALQVADVEGLLQLPRHQQPPRGATATALGRGARAAAAAAAAAPADVALQLSSDLYAALARLVQLPSSGEDAELEGIAAAVRAACGPPGADVAVGLAIQRALGVARAQVEVDAAPLLQPVLAAFLRRDASAMEPATVHRAATASGAAPTDTLQLTAAAAVAAAAAFDAVEGQFQFHEGGAVGALSPDAGGGAASSASPHAPPFSPGLTSTSSFSLPTKRQRALTALVGMQASVSQLTAGFVGAAASASNGLGSVLLLPGVDDESELLLSQQALLQLPPPASTLSSVPDAQQQPQLQQQRQRGRTHSLDEFGVGDVDIAAVAAMEAGWYPAGAVGLLEEEEDSLLSAALSRSLQPTGGRASASGMTPDHVRRAGSVHSHVGGGGGVGSRAGAPFTPAESSMGGSMTPALQRRIDGGGGIGGRVEAPAATAAAEGDATPSLSMPIYAHTASFGLGSPGVMTALSQLAHEDAAARELHHSSPHVVEADISHMHTDASLEQPVGLHPVAGSQPEQKHTSTE